MTCRIFIIAILTILTLIPVNTVAVVVCPSGIDSEEIKSKKQFRDKFTSSVFQVVVNSDNQPEETIGTATLVSNEGHFITAAHIFETGDNRILKGFESKDLKVSLRIPLDENGSFVYYSAEKIYRISDKYDLAVIEISDWNNDRRFSPISLDVKIDPSEHEVRLMGYIVNDPIASVSGTGNVLRDDTTSGYLRITDLEAYQGFSGGLLITENGMGVAVLSGKFIAEDDSGITWAEIGDKENGALNAVPLKALITQLPKIKINKTESVIQKLNKENELLKDHEFSDLIKLDRLAAIVLASKFLYEDDITTLPNFDAQWGIFRLSMCLLPDHMSKDIYRKTLEATLTDKQRKKFSTEVVKHAAKKAREFRDIDIATSLEMYQLASIAMPEAELSEEYKNYTYLDYYKTAVAAADHDIAVESPSKIIGTPIRRITAKDLNSSEVSRIVSVSRSQLFSAATYELNKSGKYYEAMVAATAAIKSNKTVTAPLINDWYYLNAKAIRVVDNEELRKELLSERAALKDSIPVFAMQEGLEASKQVNNIIGTPSDAQLQRAFSPLGEM